jgi:hypothetical protein
MSKTLLLAHHTPSPATRELLEPVLAGPTTPAGAMNTDTNGGRLVE